ncbi:MAG: hypothetical protein H6838_16910 [Planctomycetes bacterium]|nr:hypothetical protein [Planctomycetota bacterium]
MTDAADRCPQCGAFVELVHVHGHGQCPVCHTNVAPCCAGAGDEVRASGEGDAPFDPHLFERCFERLGGPRATVTTEALLHTLVEVLDVDLQAATIVLQAGEHVGAVTPAGPGCHRLVARS